MKRTSLLVTLGVLALCALVGRFAAKPISESGKLLIGRWQAVDLPPMCFSWDYQFRADGTGTQYYDNGGVMGQFRYAFDGRTLKIFRDPGSPESQQSLRFADSDNFELAGSSLTIHFHRR